MQNAHLNVLLLSLFLTATMNGRILKIKLHLQLTLFHLKPTTASFRAKKKLIGVDPSRARRIPFRRSASRGRKRLEKLSLLLSRSTRRLSYRKLTVSVQRVIALPRLVFSRFFLFIRPSTGPGRIILKDGEEKFQAKAGHHRQIDDCHIL